MEKLQWDGVSICALGFSHNRHLFEKHQYSRKVDPDYFTGSRRVSGEEHGRESLELTLLVPVAKAESMTLRRRVN